MSVDDFDPAVERLYTRPQTFADSALFDAEVEVRVYKRSRIRNFVMFALSLVAAGIFLRQVIRLNLTASFDSATVGSVLPRQEVGQVMSVAREMAANLGLADAMVAGFSGPQLMILSGLVVTALLAASAVRLSQSL